MGDQNLLQQRIQAHRSISRDWQMQQNHRHTRYEILLIRTSGVRAFIDDRIFLPEPGSLFLFDSRTLHRTVAPSDRDYDRVTVHFDASWIAPLSTPDTDLLAIFSESGRARLPLVLPRPLQEEILHFAEHIRATRPLGLSGQDVDERLSLARLLLDLHRFLSHAQVDLNLPVSDFGRLEPVMQFIREHPETDLSLTTLAERFHFSPTYFSTTFHSETGVSLSAYITRCRLLKARNLLEQGLPVQAVCELSGFGSLPHFIRTFKTHMGVTPKQYAIRTES